MKSLSAALPLVAVYKHRLVCTAPTIIKTRETATFSVHLPVFLDMLERAVLQEVGTDRAVFYDLLVHMLDTEPDNNHVFSLIK
ncbi:hypothetical protein PoB_006393300 [Plakobranchus ocellatus]|uniref:Uncharacterized protein n=1 Tax=Plakobranchus ocellatus TaxID=259542 RepID=A0AAV4CZX5_9GAST|nr:hypothetical protein PoB_006393300 [Plakobranchus ocellatus]